MGSDRPAILVAVFQMTSSEPLAICNPRASPSSGNIAVKWALYGYGTVKEPGQKLLDAIADA